MKHIIKKHMMIRNLYINIQIYTMVELHCKAVSGTAAE